jgi:hypothetical protein
MLQLCVQSTGKYRAIDGCIWLGAGSCMATGGAVACGIVIERRCITTSMVSKRSKQDRRCINCTRGSSFYFRNCRHMHAL